MLFRSCGVSAVGTISCSVGAVGGVAGWAVAQGDIDEDWSVSPFRISFERVHNGIGFVAVIHLGEGWVGVAFVSGGVVGHVWSADDEAALVEVRECLNEQGDRGIDHCVGVLVVGINVFLSLAMSIGIDFAISAFAISFVFVVSIVSIAEDS